MVVIPKARSQPLMENGDNDVPNAGTTNLPPSTRLSRPNIVWRPGLTVDSVGGPVCTPNAPDGECLVRSPFVTVRETHALYSRFKDAIMSTRKALKF